jgi:hypothetical protein
MIILKTVQEETLQDDPKNTNRNDSEEKAKEETVRRLENAKPNKDTQKIEATLSKIYNSH